MIQEATTVYIACELHRGNAKYQMAIALYWHMNHIGRYSFPVTNEVTQPFSISSRVKRNGLQELSDVGLISVVHRAGKCPLVAIENLTWFDELPTFVGFFGLSRLADRANANVDATAADAGIDVIETATFERPDIRDVLGQYTGLRKRNARFAVVPSANRLLWEEYAEILTELAVDKSVFELQPSDVRDAFSIYEQTGKIGRQKAITLVELAEFLMWLDAKEYLTKLPSDRIKGALFTLMDREFDKLPRGFYLLYERIYPSLTQWL